MKKRLALVFLAVTLLASFSLLAFAESEERLVSHKSVREYVNLLADNGIFITLPDYPTGSSAHGRTTTAYKIGQSFWITFVSYDDGRESLSFEAPLDYLPSEKAFVLLLSYTMETNEEEAQKMYDSIIYNAIVDNSDYGNPQRTTQFSKDGFSFIYLKNKFFATLDVTFAVAD